MDMYLYTIHKIIMNCFTYLGEKNNDKLLTLLTTVIETADFKIPPFIARDSKHYKEIFEKNIKSFN